ncbi:hypothetical protein [Streptomyces alfalfae]|uniref:hypothetical protein n=1 Tax=Streptomyces alfalfae TaxID=1642299 RepID=UPI002811DCE0|nr:hypothetical protein [Streptomyces alfalfae]
MRGADWRTATVTAVGAGTVTADGIVWRCLDTYTLPLVGDVAVVSQSGNGNCIAIGRLSSGDPGWTTATLGTGYTQGNTTSQGNNNGPIRYRRVPWQGGWWMEWDGGATRSNGAQTSNMLSAALAATFRPAARASFVIARNATSITGVANSTSVVHSLKCDFDTDGTVQLVTATAGDTETNWLSLKGIRYPLS